MLSYFPYQGLPLPEVTPHGFPLLVLFRQFSLWGFQRVHSVFSCACCGSTNVELLHRIATGP